MIKGNNFKLLIFLSIFWLNLSHQRASVFALYKLDDGIFTLTDVNFDQVVLSSPKVWVVEYYAPWCPYCQHFVPEMKKLAGENNNFEVAAIDADQNFEIGERYNISRFPTVQIFGKNKNIPPENYDGKLNAVNIATAAANIRF